MIWAFLIGIAGGEEPPAAEPEAAEPDAAEDVDDEDTSAEVIVYSQRLVEEARRAVVEELEEAGYDHQVIDLGDRVIYRHEAAWYGEVVLFDDGYTEVRRQPLHAVGAKMPWAKQDSPLAWAGCLVWPWLCIRLGGVTVSHRRWLNRETRTVQLVQPKVREWADRIADLSVEEKVEGLPGMLYALWEQGRPLGGSGPVLQTYRERRAALLEFYGSRTDTSWGRRVQRAVAGFLRGVVQPGDHPVTARELERFNADREIPLRLPVP